MKKIILSLALLMSLFKTQTLDAQGVWTQKANFTGTAVFEAACFSIGTKGYVGAASTELWEYDQATDSWSQMATFIGSSRNSAAGFSIGTKGYFGTGGSLNDFFEWDQPTNTWTQKANFGGSGREGAFGFATSTKGYIGMGGNYLSDLWEYDPILDAWTQVASLPGPGRYHGGAFAINDKGYVCAGFNGSFLNDLWQFDPVTNTWLQMASLPGTARDRPEGFSIGTKGYIAVGWSGSIALNDFYEWDQPSNTWTALPNLTGQARYNAISFTLGTKVYVGLGVGGVQDLWEYAPACAVQATTTSTTCYNLCDGNATVTIPDPGAVISYSWNTIPVQTTLTATGLCGVSYLITMTDTAGCTNSVSVTIPSPLAITTTATFDEPGCFGSGDGSICVAAAGGVGTLYTYIWANGQTGNCINNVPAGTFSVTVTDVNGCTGTSSHTLLQPTQMIASLSHTNASCPTCNDGNATANITGGNGPYIFNWSNGVTNSAYISNLLPGTYTCCITDADSCTICDSTTVSSLSAINNTNWVNHFSCSPNPFTQFLNLDFSTITEKQMAIQLTDLEGRVLYKKDFENKMENFRMNTDFLRAGTYILIIRSADGKRAFLKICKV